MENRHSRRAALGLFVENFLATPPTTPAGLRAALEYVVEIDDGCLPDNPDNVGRIAAALLKSPLFAGMSAEERPSQFGACTPFGPRIPFVIGQGQLIQLVQPYCQPIQIIRTRQRDSETRWLEGSAGGDAGRCPPINHYWACRPRLAR
jgi:hypothetical protein